MRRTTCVLVGIHMIFQSIFIPPQQKLLWKVGVKEQQGDANCFEIPHHFKNNKPGQWLSKKR